SFSVFAAEQLREIRFLCQASPAGEKYAKVFAGFEKYGFKVIVEQVPWVNYLEKAQLAVQSKVSPYDVINANVEWVLPSYVTSGSVLPLNEFLAKDPVDYRIGSAKLALLNPQKLGRVPFYRSETDQRYQW
ncbi:MAG: extracellular solute-binding protein, partial [Bacteroidia bacterium]|nr:extracellular solute-binding protein [Bacteroidia bacterium]